MKGKNKCKILKDIRKAIAKENDIEYVTSECKYQGDCSGTCPKCESEVRYLEAELEKRRAAGKSVALAGIAASMILSSGCGSSGNGIFTEKTMGDMAVSDYSSFESEPNSLTSEIGLVDGQIEFSQTMGEENPELDGKMEVSLMGDMEIPESSTDDESSFEIVDGEMYYITEEQSLGDIVETMGEEVPPSENAE